jgi:hypothetical protein
MVHALEKDAQTVIVTPKLLYQMEEFSTGAHRLMRIAALPYWQV